MAQPWLTVVTVVKNDLDGFTRTIGSLAAQDRQDVEYVVIDSSVDQKAVPGVIASFPAVETRYAWSSPQGIYAAMNAALAMATGRYIYFANAGDAFYTPDVLAQVRQTINRAVPQWCFGAVAIESISGRSVITPPWDYAREKARCFAAGLFPPHQGTFVRTDLLRAQGGFDTGYSIAADYASFLKLTQESDPVPLGIVIASFAEGGVSTQHWQASFREFHRARREILQPRGLAAVRESVSTAAHFARVFAYRSVWLRIHTGQAESRA